MNAKETTLGPRHSPVRITFAVFGFNQAAFIEDAVKAACDQSLVPVEILLVDDASSDETPQIMTRLAEAYRGPARMRVIVNESNRGLVANLSMVMDLAKGDLVVIAAGDDISCPDRAQKLADAWNQAGRPRVCVHSCAYSMDASGRSTGHINGPWNLEALADPVLMLRRGASMLGATVACPRSLFERYGPFTISGICNVEDVALSFRSALEGGSLYVAEPLVRYRVGLGISTKAFSPKNPREYLRHALRRVEHSITCTEQMALDVETWGGDVRRLRHLLQNRRLVLQCVKASYENRWWSLGYAIPAVAHAAIHEGFAQWRVLAKAVRRAVTGRL